jgi:outer membrane protein TolC
LRIAGEVREAAWTLAALQAELAQADAQLRSLQGLADDVERRVRAGDLARADTLATRAELLSASARQAEAQQRLLEAHSHWVVLTGLQAWPVMQQSAAEPAAAPGGEAMSLHPELRLAAQAVEVARRRFDVMRNSRRDPPEIALGLRQEVPGRSELMQNSIAIGLRLPFGTDDRNQPLQAAALSELDVAQAREQRLRDRLDASVAAARSALRSAERQLADTRDRAGLLRERAQLIDKSFRAGESPLPDLLRALDASAQADASLARQQAALGLARARLQQAEGLLP